jgi:hypothetical protein
VFTYFFKKLYVKSYINKKKAISKYIAISVAKGKNQIYNMRYIANKRFGKKIRKRMRWEYVL